MSFFEKLKKDWGLFQQQAENTKVCKWVVRDGKEVSILRLFTFLAGIVMIAFSARLSPIVYAAIWLAIPIFLTCIHFLNINLNKSFRKFLIATVLFQSFGVFMNRDDIQDYVGYRYVEGYHSHYETVYVQYGEVDDDQEVLVYECSHWTGHLIIGFFHSYIFIPLILVLPYFSWKMGQTLSAQPK